MRNWLTGCSSGAEELAEPRSMVRVLRDDDELDAALKRAIETEGDAIARSRELISHYEQMESSGVVVSMPRSSSKGRDDEHQLRSA